jgi:uncharacterized protein YukE
VPAADHFYIDPQPVNALAADFTSSASQLRTKVSAFAAQAENVNDAFGVMSQSTEALAKYVQMTQSTVTALQGLANALDHYATGIDQTVASYQATDQAHAQQLGKGA